MHEFLEKMFKKYRSKIRSNLIEISTENFPESPSRYNVRENRYANLVVRNIKIFFSDSQIAQLKIDIYLTKKTVFVSGNKKKS